MLQALSKHQTAKLLKLLCEQHGVSPQAILREVHDDGVRITDTMLLIRAHGLYCISRISPDIAEHLHDRYAIFIDDVPTFSRPTSNQAYELAKQVMEILPLARAIRILDNETHTTLHQWARVRDVVGTWIKALL